jgi:phosphatidylglycerophosphate synthase
MSVPTLAEVRAGGQPAGLKERRNEEHWAGRLYMRDISPYFTWFFVRLGVAPNTLTGWMVVSGVLAGVVFALAGQGTAGLLAALGGALLVQIYLMLDCADGEVARFTDRRSVTGVYLDRIGHYMSEVAILVGLGVRAQGEFTAGGWVVAGVAAALGAALIKAETDNVVVARAKSGLPAEPERGDGALAPRASGLALARRLASMIGFHRIIGAVELSLLIVVAALIDWWFGSGLAKVVSGLGAGDGSGPLGALAASLVAGASADGALVATRLLMIATVLVAGVQTVLHLVSVLASRRLE